MKPIILVLCLALTACTAPPQLFQSQWTRNLPDLSSRPVPERLVPIPAILLADLRTWDRDPSYQAHDLSPRERQVVEDCLNRLPHPLRQALEDNVLGISFIDGFAGGGLTWDTFSDSRKRDKDWLVFNAQTLKKTMEQWLTFRDETAFDSPGVEERVSTPWPGFQATVIHEAAHVFDFAHGVTDSALRQPFESTPEGSTGAFGFGIPYPLDANLHFYHRQGTTPLPHARLASVLERLVPSGFASLYGSQTDQEDWAEAVTYGVLARDLGLEVSVHWSGPQGERSFVPATAPASRARIAKALALLDGAASGVVFEVNKD